MLEGVGLPLEGLCFFGFLYGFLHAWGDALEIAAVPAFGMVPDQNKLAERDVRADRVGPVRGLTASFFDFSKYHS